MRPNQREPGHRERQFCLTTHFIVGRSCDSSKSPLESNVCLSKFEERQPRIQLRNLPVPTK